MKYSFVTMATEDFVKGVVALSNSLRAVSQIPLVCMTLNVSQDSKDLLTDKSIECIDIESIANPYSGKPNSNNSRFKDVYTKIRAFGLSQFDRIVFLDSDTLVLKNIDDLFETKGFAAAPDHGIGLNPNRFNSGVFAVDPSAALLKRMLNEIPKTVSCDNSDQGFLNVFYKSKWTRLDYRYNTLKRIYSHHPKMFNMDEIKVLHFVGDKPWAIKSGEDYIKYLKLNKLWWSYYGMKHG